MLYKVIKVLYNIVNQYNKSILSNQSYFLKDDSEINEKHGLILDYGGIIPTGNNKLFLNFILKMTCAIIIKTYISKKVCYVETNFLIIMKD